MHKPIAEAFSVEPKALVEDEVDDQRKDAEPRPPTLGRRTSPRRRVLLSALIVDPAKELRVSCRIENVSDNGARIKLAEPRFLPPTFWLIALTSGLAYRATTIWREDERLGVEVGEPIDLSDPTDPAGHRLRQIWKTWR